MPIVATGTLCRCWFHSRAASVLFWAKSKSLSREGYHFPSRCRERAANSCVTELVRILSTSIQNLFLLGGNMKGFGNAVLVMLVCSSVCFSSSLYTDRTAFLAAV